MEAGANGETTVLAQTEGRVRWTRAQLRSWSEGAGSWHWDLVVERKTEGSEQTCGRAQVAEGCIWR